MCLAASIALNSRLCLGLSVLSIIALFLCRTGSWQRSLGFTAIAMAATYTALVYFDSPLLGKLAGLAKPNERYGLWLAVMAERNCCSVFGNGPLSFSSAYKYAMAAGVLPKWIPLEPRSVGWAHNVFVEALHERGYFGLAMLLWLYLKISVCLWAQKTGEKLARPTILGILSPFLLYSLFEMTLYKTASLLILGIFSALAVSSSLTCRTGIPLYHASIGARRHTPQDIAVLLTLALFLLLPGLRIQLIDIEDEWIDAFCPAYVQTLPDQPKTRVQHKVRSCMVNLKNELRLTPLAYMLRVRESTSKAVVYGVLASKITMILVAIPLFWRVLLTYRPCVLKEGATKASSRKIR
jgi:hypothetical protein